MKAEDTPAMDNYNESEIRAAFEEWVQAQGYKRAKGRSGEWKPFRLGYTCRIQAEGSNKAGAGHGSATYFTDKPAGGVINDFKGDRRVWNYWRDYLKGDTSHEYYKNMPKGEELKKIQADRIKAETELIEAQRLEILKEFESFKLYAPAEDEPLHCYLQAKSVEPHKGLRLDGKGELIIPAYDSTNLNRFMTYQRILKKPLPDGKNKLFATGGVAKGSCFVMGELGGADAIGIAEGYATAATVHSLTGLPVVSVFYADNMPTVAGNIKKAYPQAKLIIFADNDIATVEEAQKRGETVKNAGITKAQQTIAELGLEPECLATPPDEFAERGKHCSDWNDYARDRHEEARQALGSAVDFILTNPSPALSEFRALPVASLARTQSKMLKAGAGISLNLHMFNSNTQAEGRSQEVKFNGLTLIAARTGGGKTTLLTNFAARALEVNENAKVLFISLEEAEDSIHKRMIAAQAKCLSMQDINSLIWSNGNIGDAHKWQIINETADELSKRELKIVDLIDVPDIKRAEKCRQIIEAARAEWGSDAIIFIDYIQKLKGEGAAGQGYKEFKDIVEQIQPLISSGVTIFAAAQMNREGARNSINDKGKEFWEAIPEQIREAGDLEQAAEKLLFCVIDKTKPEHFANIRLLKNRRGSSDLSVAIPLDYDKGGLQWGTQRISTFSESSGKANGNGAAQENGKKGGSTYVGDLYPR